jgi:parvulin-like peptidyl-prolyl isomerase
VLRIGELEISRADMESELTKGLPDSTRNDSAARREFAETFVNRQLLVLAARDAGFFAPDSTREFMLRGMEESILVEQIRDAEIRSHLEVTPQEVEAFYAKLAVTYDLSQIVVATVEEAEVVKGRLAAGEDFAALAGELSLHRSARNGGKLPSFVWGSTNSTFLEAVDSMEPGEIRGPIESSIGYHVLQLNGRLPNEHLQPLSETREFIEQQCGILAAMDAQKEYYERLAQRHHFTANWPVLLEETRLLKAALAAARDSVPGASSESQQALAKGLLTLPDTLRHQPLATWDSGQYTVHDHRVFLAPLPGLGLVDRRNPHVSLGDAVSTFNRAAMVEQARSRGLDQDPDLKRRIESKREELAVNDFYAQEVIGKATFTEVEEREYYEANPAHFTVKPQVKLALIQYERDAEAAADMEAALGSSSTDPDSVLGAHIEAGLIRNRIPQGEWYGEAGNPILFGRAAELEIGEVARVIDEDGYWTVFVLIERDEGGLLPFDEVRNTVQTSLRNLRSEKILNEVLDGLKIEHPVWIDDAYFDQTGESD